MAKHALLYTVSRVDVLLTSISLASVLDHYQSPEPLDVLVIGADIFNSDIELIRSLPQRFHKPQVNIFFFTPPAELDQIKNYQSEKFPMVVNWRLYAPNMFPQYDRLLYLDNDTLVYTDVLPMFDLCPDDKVLAGVPDFFYYSQRAWFMHIDAPELKDTQKYINSGVILFNVPRYNQMIRPEAISKMLSETHYKYPDQTVINRLAVNEMAFLGLNYNYQKDDSWLFWAKRRYPETFADFEQARKNIKIRHFVGYLLRSRPWQHLASYDQFERDFWHYEMLVRQYYLDQSQRLHYNTKSRLDNAYLDEDGNKLP
ncbi:glucosyltransferase [Levilactobacillus zymae]|uniref:Glucosyltransferase n=1 Tax=Levilactobacillus zymae TaxID=267363 RepID=A0ABQ0WZ31_9LACO|nr:glycosyltransferase [Levilactobacillus zymae]KRL07571.1 glycosyltransferase [Levilactobacillus zymae DSM 19395]QFR62046.1 glycosyltransferase family 8 protein [Levilactobacillus zymae]GEO71592.1 glucosyltransferase [Levilactobacillus zymae]